MQGPVKTPRRGPPRRRPGRVAGWAAVLLLLIGACEDDPVQPPVPGAADVVGAVATVKSAEGVANALVVLLQGGDVVRVTATDAAGEFRFASVEPGTYRARLAGLELTRLSLSSTAFVPEQQQVVVAGRPVELFFSGIGVVAPRVDGEVRCAGAAVTDAALRVAGGAIDRTVRTDAQGRFGATGLDAGVYAVLLSDAPGGCRFEPRWRVVELRQGQEATELFHGER